jgi:hypothetical protein
MFSNGRERRKERSQLIRLPVRDAIVTGEPVARGAKSRERSLFENSSHRNMARVMNRQVESREHPFLRTGVSTDRQRYARIRSHVSSRRATDVGVGD